jgi:Na+-transporting NADH:ubiquinone oxidoreductase subunit F
MRFLRKLHKWLGLLIALQVILWAASGVMFAWLDHSKVGAVGSVRTVEASVLVPALVRSEPTAWLNEYAQQDLYDVRAISLADRWVWRVELQDRVELLALERYAGGGAPGAVTLQTQPDIESRSKTPVWRAQFDDSQRTALYFAADDGHFIAARTTSWRLYDFFWMLHTMDYSGRDDFNNPLIITIGMAALWLSISGIVLLTRSFR